MSIFYVILVKISKNVKNRKNKNFRPFSPRAENDSYSLGFLLGNLGEFHENPPKVKDFMISDFFTKLGEISLK